MPHLNLILLRHGRTEHNVGLRLTGWGDTELDETGLLQADAAAERLLANHTIDALYASPLKRAHFTALPLSKATGLEINFHPGLREMFFGDVEGWTIAEVQEKYTDYFAKWRSLDEPEFRWPGGESRREFHDRVTAAIWEIISKEYGKSETIAIVAHGGSLSGFITEVITGSPLGWRQYLLDNTEHFHVRAEISGTELPSPANTKFEIVHTGRLMPMAPNR